MAELVDALVSDASGETRGSSSLLGRTKNQKIGIELSIPLFFVYY